MDQTILIPIDGSESVDETLLYVRSLSSNADTSIVVLHVTPEVNAGNASLETHPNVKAISDALSADGLKVTREARMGDPVREIIKLAIMLPATLLTMSTHGRSGLELIREGSVTEKVVRQSPCPVFILHSSRPEPADKRTTDLFKRILVPLDGTDASSAILGCVEQFAKIHDSDVVLFHDELEHMESETEKNAVKAKLQEQSVTLANTGVTVSLDMTTYKHPIREILDRVDGMKIDLISMASHGEAGVRRAMDESVTADVIRHANCPLLVWSAEPQCPPLKALK